MNNFTIDVTAQNEPTFQAAGETPADRGGPVALDPLLWSTAGASDAGVPVNSRTCLGQATIRYGVDRISGHLASMPLNCWRRDGARVIEAVQHPGRMLTMVWASGDPAVTGDLRPDMGIVSPAEWKQSIVSNSLLETNGVSWIRRNVNGDPIQLVRADPRNSWPFRTYGTAEDGQLWWRLSLPRDSSSGALDPMDGGGYMVVARPRDVFVLPSLTWTGIGGVNTAQLSRNDIGLGIVAEQQSNYFYRNNATPTMVLEAPEHAFEDEKEALEFLNKFNSWCAGPKRYANAAMLTRGIKANPLQQNGRDSQNIEQRQFAREDQAQLLGLESVLGDQDSNSYNSVEAKFRAYLTNALLQLIVKMEQQCNLKLLRLREIRAQSHFFKFDTFELLRGSPSDLTDMLVKQVGAGLLNLDEARAIDNRSPIPGGNGKTFFVSANTKTLEQAISEGETDPHQDPVADPAADADLDLSLNGRL